MSVAPALCLPAYGASAVPAIHPSTYRRGGGENALQVLTVINNLTKSSTATIMLSSQIIIMETHSQWHHSIAHILTYKYTCIHTHTHTHRNTHRGSTTCLTKFNPLSYPFWLCCVQRVEIWVTGQWSICLTFQFLLIIRSPVFDVFKCLPPASADYKCCHVFADDKSHLHIYTYMLASYKWHPPVSWLQALSFHVCWLHMSFCLLVTGIVLLHWLLSSYVCWLQVTSSCFLMTRIVLQCLLVTRVVLQCSLIKSIVLCWLVTNVVLQCFLTTNVVLCLLIISAVLCLLIKSAVLSLLLQVLSYVCWLQILSNVCWLQVLSYVGWLQVLS